MIGLGKRLSYAFRSFVAILVQGEIPDDIGREMGRRPAPVARLATETLAVPATPAAQAPPTDAVDRAVQLLALLQRDGRLLDFFSEDLASYSDAQIGAAARSVHESCRQVLDRYIALEPILDSDEGQTVTVQADVDPATTKLIGNVAGTPPLRGVLRHRGWRATQVNLPPLPTGAGRAVVAPAEVEIS
ncbi:hypothetical protein NKDENANG_02068 [Candidatus Entotheonellaceae bacterium PAL068K]